MTRDELKRKIVNYLVSVEVNDKALWTKSLQAIKDAAYSSCLLDKDMQKQYRKEISEIGLRIGDEFYYRLTWSFSPRHYYTLVGFVKEFEAISNTEIEKEMELEAKIEEAIRQEIDPLEDEYYDDLGSPDYAVCIYPDRIEVRAYGPGVGEIIPKKSRKYIGCQGNIRWRYPVSMLPELQKLSCPIVNVADFQTV